MIYIYLLIQDYFFSNISPVMNKTIKGELIPSLTERVLLGVSTRSNISVTFSLPPAIIRPETTPCQLLSAGISRKMDNKKDVFLRNFLVNFEREKVQIIAKTNVKPSE